MVFNAGLEHQQRWNADQQKPDCGLDEVVDSRAIEGPQMNKKTDTSN